MSERASYLLAQTKDAGSGASLVCVLLLFFEASSSKPLLPSDPLQAALREVAIMSRLSHPHVLRLLGDMEVPRPVILTEYMPGGSLRALLDSRRDNPLPRLAQLMIALQVAEASAGPEFTGVCTLTQKGTESDASRSWLPRSLFAAAL